MEHLRANLLLLCPQGSYRGLARKGRARKGRVVPLDESQKAHMTQIFTQTVRQSQVLSALPPPGAKPSGATTDAASLEATVVTPAFDGQKLSFAFRMMLDELEPGESIDLEGLYGALIRDLKQPSSAILELCVVLRSRLQRFGEVALPKEASEIEVEQLQAITQRFEDRWRQQQLLQAAEKEVEGPFAEKDKSDPDVPVFAAPKKRRTIAGANANLVISLIVCFVGTLGWASFRWLTKEPVAVAIHPAKAGAGLPCGPGSYANAQNAVCKVTKEFLDNEKPAALQTRAQVTKRQYLHLYNTHRLLVMTEDGRVRGVY